MQNFKLQSQRTWLMPCKYVVSIDMQVLTVGICPVQHRLCASISSHHSNRCYTAIFIGKMDGF